MSTSSIAAAEPGSAEDQAYFRQLEERFLALRGKATLLAADDWQAAREWRRAGIPADLVIAVMEQLFARQRERRSKRGISSLRYFRAAVDAAWHERLEQAAGSFRRADADPGPPVAQRLRALAAALPAELPGRSGLATRLLSLAGGLEEVEQALAELDREAVAVLLGTLPDPEAAALAARVERALGAVHAALPADQIATARERLVRQAVRERFGLPLLSLFSPAALTDPALDA